MRNAKTRKWVLSCLGWLLLYLYFQPNLWFTLNAWRVFSPDPQVSRHFAGELRPLAAFYFVCLAWYLVVNLAEEMRRLPNRKE